MTKRYFVFIALIALALLPAVAQAIPLGTGRLVAVTPVDGGCVAGPTGGTVQAWDVERQKTYTITLSNVTECDGATINVRVQSSYPTQQYWDLVATYVSPGVYEFNFYMPQNGACTFPIFYCTTPGDITTGLRARRNDGGDFQGHLRASYFGPGCTNPEPISGGDCGTIPVEDSSWGSIKALYD